MSHQTYELHQSTSDIFFMVIFSLFMSIIYCERIIKDIMIFYDCNLTEALKKRVEVYFCFLGGFSFMISSMIIEGSIAERVLQWLIEIIKSIVKPTIHDLLVVIIIMLIFLYTGIKKNLDLHHTFLNFKNKLIDDFKYELIILATFVIVAFLADLIIKAIGNIENAAIAIIIKQFVLGIPFIFLWGCIYYFIIYGTNLKTPMTDYAYNNGLLKDSIIYTLMAAIFVNGIYKLKLIFPILKLELRWIFFVILAAIALISAIVSVYCDLKYNEKLIYIIKNYDKEDKLNNPLISQILYEYPKIKDLKIVSRHIFRRDFMIIVPFIIFIISWLIWNIGSVPYVR